MRAYGHAIVALRVPVVGYGVCVSMGSLVGGFYGLAFLMAVEASRSRQQGGLLRLHDRTKSVGLLAEERRYTQER